MKSVVEKKFAPHCSSGLFTLKFHPLGHVVEDLSKFGGLSFVDAGPFEHINVLVNRSYRMTAHISRSYRMTAPRLST